MWRRNLCILFLFPALPCMSKVTGEIKVYIKVQKKKEANQSFESEDEDLYEFSIIFPSSYCSPKALPDDSL